MNKILFLPLDERPCNYLFPKKLIQMSKDYELCIPPTEILGKKKIPSDFLKIKEFMLENVSTCENAVISLDQLLYGGIVPSRLHYLSAQKLNERLSLIKELKRINPSLKIYAFVLIMRCPRYSSSDEEPDYYEEYGQRIYEWGVQAHQGISLLNFDIGLERAVKDFTARRKINLSLIKKIIEYTDEFIDYLIIPQDDSAPYGFTMMDRIEILKLLENVDKSKYEIYPGADEVGMTLISRVISKDYGKKKYYLDCLYEECLTMIPAYENKELKDTINHQINAAGGILVENEEDADIILYLNYDSDKQLETASINNYRLDKKRVQAQIARMKKNIKIKTCGLVDKTFVNGGNLEYLSEIFKEVSFFDLAIYAGWNTSSNTLGTVISGCMMVNVFGPSENSRRFNVERLYDDGIYQSIVRKRICDEVLPSMNLNYFKVDAEKGKVSLIIKDYLEREMKERFIDIYEKYPTIKVSQPWKRMFETLVEVVK